MGAPKTGNVRNVVLVGQGGVGKTSLAEAMLHLSGKTARLGGHDGTKPTRRPKSRADGFCRIPSGTQSCFPHAWKGEVFR